MSSIFMRLDPCGGPGCYGAVFSENVLDDFVQHFRLHRLLHEMACPALQCGHDVFLIAHGRHHDDPGLGMRLNDFLSGFDTLHLRHGDVHEHDVGMGPVELADGGQPIPGLGRHLPAKTFDHAGQILAGEHGIVDDQVTDRLSVLASFYWCKLLHNNLLEQIASRRFPAGQMTQVAGPGQKLALAPGAECFSRSANLPTAFPADTKSLQSGGEYIESHHSHGITALDANSWHPEDHTGLFALSDRHAAGSLYRAQPFRAVVAHAGHQHRDCVRAEFFSHAMEQNVYAGTVAVDSGFLIEHHQISHGEPFYFDVPASGADQHAPGLQHVTGLRFLHAQRAQLVQAARKHVGKALGHVLHDYDRSRKVW